MTGVAGSDRRVGPFGRVLLRYARLADGLSEGLGWLAKWLVPVCVLVGFVNVLLRYIGRCQHRALTSNRYVEPQWMLFGAIFLLAFPYVLKHASTSGSTSGTPDFSRSAQALIDFVGHLIGLVPYCLFALWVNWDYAADVAVPEGRTLGHVAGVGGLGAVARRHGACRGRRSRCSLLVGSCFLLLQTLAELVKLGFVLTEKAELAAPEEPRRRRSGSSDHVTGVEESMGEWLAIVMFVLFLGLILVGYPVAFSFALTGVVSRPSASASTSSSPVQLEPCPSRWFGYISDQNLLAIPFFVYMGAIFEKSGQAERLLTAIGRLMGPVRGGTGPHGRRRRHDARRRHRRGGRHRHHDGPDLAAGDGALRLRPPAGDRRHRRLGHAGPADPAEPRADRARQPDAEVSVGALFRGAIIPGLLLAGLYALYVGYVAIRYPEKAPALPLEERQAFRGGRSVKESVIAIVPPILLIVCVLGAIFQGIATPSEVGSVGAVAAALLALLNGRLSWKVIGDAARSTANITGLVMMMLLASNFFAYVFDLLGGQDLVSGLAHRPARRLLDVRHHRQHRRVPPRHQPRVPRDQLHRHADLHADRRRAGHRPGVVPGDDGGQPNIAFISPPVGFSLFYLQSVKPAEVRDRRHPPRRAAVRAACSSWRWSS